MTPFVELFVNGQRVQALRTLGDDDARTALVQLRDDPVGIERLVGDQSAEFDVLNQWRNADRVITLAGKEDETDEIAERIGQGEDFGGPSAFGLADGLILSPPFAPWP
jgi:hypothetical protein